MKYNHPETSIATIIGPEQTTWVGDLTLHVLLEDETIAVIKGQKSAQFEIDEDTRFTIRTVNTAFPTLEVEVAALLSRPTTIKLYVVGGSNESAKLVAKTTYGEYYSKRK
ncbi:MAG: hypothetical protein EOM77_00965 [Bacteroidia bacterium]|nr:hypothetical protein [Bacteroidia bacterium]